MKLLKLIPLLILLNLSVDAFGAARSPCDRGQHHTYSCQDWVFNGQSKMLSLIPAFTQNRLKHSFFGNWTENMQVHQRTGKILFGHTGPSIKMYKKSDGRAYVSRAQRETALRGNDQFTTKFELQDANHNRHFMQCRYFMRAQKKHKLCRWWVDGQYAGYAGYVQR